MKDTLTGIVHGKTIELSEEPGLPDGELVLVTLSRAAADLPSDEGREVLRRAAGAWSDDIEGPDRDLEWNRQQRRPNGQALAE